MVSDEDTRDADRSKSLLVDVAGNGSCILIIGMGMILVYIGRVRDGSTSCRHY